MQKVVQSLDFRRKKELDLMKPKLCRFLQCDLGQVLYL